MVVSARQKVTTYLLNQYGSAEHKERWLKPLLVAQFEYVESPASKLAIRTLFGY